VNKSASKRRAIPASRYYRERREWKKLIRDAQQDARASRDGLYEARTTNKMLERRVYDLGMLYQTGEAYYRAQRIIANLLGQEAAAISADLKQEILGALYHGMLVKRGRVDLRPTSNGSRTLSE
jgi:hypothetical protein